MLADVRAAIKGMTLFAQSDFADGLANMIAYLHANSSTYMGIRKWKELLFCSRSLATPTFQPSMHVNSLPARLPGTPTPLYCPSLPSLQAQMVRRHRFSLEEEEGDEGDNDGVAAARNVGYGNRIKDSAWNRLTHGGRALDDFDAEELSVGALGEWGDEDDDDGGRAVGGSTWLTSDDESHAMFINPLCNMVTVQSEA